MRKTGVIKIALLAIILIVILLNFSKVSQYFDSAESLIRNSGALGPIIYGILMIIAILVSPIPASPLAIMAGTIFGPWLGMIYTLVFATLGAIIAFLLARFLLRNFLSKYYENHKLYKKFEGKKDINITYLVFLTRLMPQVSFDIVSYLAGLTKLRLSWFALATFLGMIPIVFVLSFFGYLIEPYKNTMLVILLAIFIVWIVYFLKKKN